MIVRSLALRLRRAATFAAGLAALATLPLQASAGSNAGANAYLTWNATDRNVTDTSPAAANNLYVYIERGTNKLQFKGGEVDLTWDPASDGLGCFDHIGTTYKTSSGTTCTYLNRGSAVPVATVDDEHHFHVAWANTSSLTSCSAGAIIQIQFETDGCADATGCFTLNSCLLLDSSNNQDQATVVGSHATVLGGGTHCNGGVNQPPVIQPIGNQTVNVATLLTVTPSASDPDNDPLSFTGSNLPVGAFVDSTSGVLIYTPGTGSQATYPNVTLTASDHKGGTDSASFSIIVPNRAPGIFTPSNQTAAEGALLSFTASGSDPDGDALTWSAANFWPAGASIAPATGVFTWTPAFNQAGSYTGLSLKATDPFGGSMSTSFDVTVTNTNRAPIVDPIIDQYTIAGQLLTVTPSGHDPDGDALTWSGNHLPSGATVAPSSGVLSWTPGAGQVGTYPGVELVASDGVLGGLASFAITVGTAPNTPPDIAPVADQVVAENALLSVTGSASDADNDPLSWSATNLPSGAAFAPALATLTWTPAFDQAGSYAGVTFMVNDGRGGTASTAFAITVTNVNRAPSVAAIPNQDVTVGQLLQVQPVGSDPDGDALAWSGSNLPSGAQVDAATGLFAWTPGSAQTGSYTVTLTATDPSNAAASADMHVTVHGGVGNDGAQAWLSWSSSSVVGDLTSPGASNNLYVRVAGANSFKGGELDLTWVPSGDGNGCYDHISTVYKTSTDCTYLNRGSAVPIVTADAPNHFHVAWANSLTNITCGGGGNAIVLGFEFDGCTTPPPGCFTLESMTLLDGNNAISSAQVLGANATVLGGSSQCGNTNQPPVIAGIPNQSVIANHLLTVTPSASDPDGDSLQYTGSYLPAGSVVNLYTGVFSWTPDNSQVGTYAHVTISANDGRGGVGSAPFDITVQRDTGNNPPVVAPIADQTVTSGTLVAIVASANDPDGDVVTWSGQNFPSGATIDAVTGIFRWTPSLPGVYSNITLIATDPFGASGSSAFTVTVTGAIALSYFVDPQSACTQCDGRSWATAFHSITDGLAAMTDNGSPDSLFVAEGVYREPTIVSLPYKQLFGGYPHGGGTRDLALHRTVLGASGKIPPIAVLHSAVTMDGFTLTGLRTSSQSAYGALVIDGTNATARSLWITGNSCPGASVVQVRLPASNAVLDRCIISQNVVGTAGCINVATGTTATLRDCDVVADSVKAAGGVTFLTSNGTVTIVNTLVWQMMPASRPLISNTANVTTTFSDLAQFDPLLCSISGRQFSLQPGSPCIGAGEGGTTIGAIDVVGCGAPAPPLASPSAGGEEIAETAHATGLIGDAMVAAGDGITLGYALADDAPVQLEVFNATGQRVATLKSGASARGTHIARWAMRRDDGTPVSAGIYLIRFASGSVTQTRRIVVVR